MALPANDKEAAVELVLVDLRRLYDHINANWVNLKNRVLTVTFGEVAIASFIFSTKFNLHKFTSAELIFFFTGVALMLGSFTVLVWIMSGSHWIIPLDTSESRKLYARYHSKLDYLEHVKVDYEDTIDACLEKHELRAKIFNKVLIGLMCGILILLVIKFTR